MAVGNDLLDRFRSVPAACRSRIAVRSCAAGRWRRVLPASPTPARVCRRARAHSARALRVGVDQDNRSLPPRRRDGKMRGDRRLSGAAFWLATASVIPANRRRALSGFPVVLAAAHLVRRLRRRPCPFTLGFLGSGAGSAAPRPQVFLPFGRLRLRRGLLQCSTQGLGLAHDRSAARLGLPECFRRSVSGLPSSVCAAVGSGVPAPHALSALWSASGSGYPRHPQRLGRLERSAPPAPGLPALGRGTAVPSRAPGVEDAIFRRGRSQRSNLLPTTRRPKGPWPRPRGRRV